MQIHLTTRHLVGLAVIAIGVYAIVDGTRTIAGASGTTTPDATLGAPPQSFVDGTGQLPQTGVRPAGDGYTTGVVAGGRSVTAPDGRFSLRVPDGWEAAQQNGGLVVTREAATVVVSPFAGATTGEDVVSVLARQYGEQWRGLRLMDRGQYALGGVPSAYGMFQGTDPRGRAMLLRLVGAVGPNGALAVIMSVPAQEFSTAAPTLQSIETSVAWR